MAKMTPKNSKMLQIILNSQNFDSDFRSFRPLSSTRKFLKFEDKKTVFEQFPNVFVN